MGLGPAGPGVDFRSGGHLAHLVDPQRLPPVGANGHPPCPSLILARVFQKPWLVGSAAM